MSAASNRLNPSNSSPAISTEVLVDTPEAILAFSDTASTRVKEVIAFVKSQGGLDYAVLKMKKFQQEALSLLSKYSESPYKASLELMVNYVIERKK